MTILNQYFSVPTPIDVFGSNKTAIILGTGSDIGKELTIRLEKDGWQVYGTSRSHTILPKNKWDLLVVCQGTMEPIGRFVDVATSDWDRCIWVNALAPLADLRELYKTRSFGASVVFLSGPNPSRASPTYSAYACAKALLREAARTIQAEHTDIKVRMIRTGVVKTKFHYQTLAAGDRAANLDRVRGIMDGKETTTTHDEIYRLVTEHAQA